MTALATRTQVDINRLIGELEHLATFSDAPAPAVTRILWTESDREARAYLNGLFSEAGLKVRHDALGNIFARWEGSETGAGSVGTGSHIDAIPHSGRYDGTIGVIGAIEALRALKRAGYSPRKSLEVLMFTSEEPTRFGIGCLGSRALSGAWTPEQLGALRDNEGVTLNEARHAAGYDGHLPDVALPLDYYDAFVELHIEQGPELEKKGLPIGIVSAIAAPATLRVELKGEGGHAGARLMPGRKDALLMGAEIALAVEKAALSTGVIDTVGTTGRFEIHPNAVNSIPSRALLEIDIRDIDGDRRDTVVAQVRAAIEAIGAKREVNFEIQTLNADPPAVCAPVVVEATQKACATLGLDYQSMVSRAYHDSLFMARHWPTGMVFIPCRGGVSHRPDEYSSPEEIERGVATLALTLAALAA